MNMIQAPRYFDSGEDATTELKAKTVRGGVVTIASHGVKQAVNVLSLVVLGQILDPSDYGLVAMAGVIAGFVALFQDLGLAVATIQRPVITHPQVSTLFWLNMAVSILLGGIFALLAQPIALFYGEPRVAPVAVALAFGFPLSGAVSQHLALLRRVMAFSRIAWVEIVASLLGVALGIAAAVVGRERWPSYNYSSLIVVTLGTSLFRCIGGWIASGWTPSLPTRGSGVRPMVRFGVGLTGSGFLTYISRNLDSLLIGKFFGGEVLGVYDRGYALFLAPQRKLLSPLANAFVPSLSRIADNKERFQAAYLELAEKIALVAVGLVTTLVLSAESLVATLLPPRWSEAAVYFAVLGPLGVAQALSSTGYWAMTAKGEVGAIFRLNALQTLVSVIAIVAAAPFGPLAVAYSFMLTGVAIRAPLVLWGLASTTGIRLGALARRCGPLLAAAAFEAGVVRILLFLLPLEIPPILKLAVLSTSGVATYVSGLLMFASGRRSLKEVVGLLLYLKTRVA